MTRRPGLYGPTNSVAAVIAAILGAASTKDAKP